MITYLSRLSKHLQILLLITLLVYIIIIFYVAATPGGAQQLDEPITPTKQFTMTEPATAASAESASLAAAYPELSVVLPAEEPIEEAMERSAAASATITMLTVRPATTQALKAEYYGTEFKLTGAERQMLATLVYLEAGMESYKCQKAVASVILNRMKTKGTSLRAVIFEKNQFTPASKITSNKPSKSTLNAVDDVLANGTTLPIYVTYFREGYYHKWAGHKPYCAIDHTYFSYDESLRKQYEPA